MNVQMKVNAFELPRVESESYGGGKYTSITTLNEIKVTNKAKRVQEGKSVDKVIDAVVELCKTLFDRHENIFTI